MLSAYDATTTFPIFRPTYIQPFCVDNIQKNLKQKWISAENREFYLVLLKSSIALKKLDKVLRFLPNLGYFLDWV